MQNINTQHVTVRFEFVFKTCAAVLTWPSLAVCSACLNIWTQSHGTITPPAICPPVMGIFVSGTSVPPDRGQEGTQTICKCIASPNLALGNAGTENIVTWRLPSMLRCGVPHIFRLYVYRQNRTRSSTGSSADIRMKRVKSEISAPLLQRFGAFAAAVPPTHPSFDFNLPDSSVGFELHIHHRQNSFSGPRPIGNF